MSGGVRAVLRRWLPGRRPRRPFQAFQIEVTTRCTLRCVMCPRTALGEEWPEADLPWQAFLRVAQAFPRVRHVHLQGWGEPLLHPRLFEMIATVKAAGCRVGLTTNGTRLDGETAARLLDLGVDLVAISVAGATAATHGAIRVGSDLPALLESAGRLVALRAGRGCPKVEFAYLMTPSNLAELPAAVAIAARLGVDEVYAANVDYLPGPGQEPLAAFADAGGRPARQALVAEAAACARGAGVAFRAYPLAPEEVGVCEANPLAILFVASDGWLSPCTYLGLAGRTRIPRWFDGREAGVPRLRFGHVMAQDVQAIWETPEYRAFRRQFAARRVAAALSLLAPARGETRPGARQAPAACRSCYKLYGL